MESTRLIDALMELRKQYEEPVSHLDVLRSLAMREVARVDVFNEEQRKVLLADVDQLTDFLQSDDGTDAVELLMDSFRVFVARKGSG